MSMIIIDTSVAFKWFDKSESNYEEARKILKDHLVGNQEIIIPDLFFYELTNAWSTKSALQAKDIKNNLEKIKKYSLTIIPVDFVILEKTVEFAKKFTVSVYDATYAILASEKKCNLITADSKFIELVKQDYIINLSKQ